MAHKVYDVNKKFVFEGTPEEVYEYFLKLRSTENEYSMSQYEYYLENKKK